MKHEPHRTPRSGDVDLAQIGTPAPDWLARYLRAVLDRLGCGPWRIGAVRLYDYSASGESVVARCHISDGSSYAWFVFPPDIAWDQGGAHLAVHEALHVFYREEERQIDRLVARLPKAVRRRVHHVYWTWHEEQLDRLAYYLACAWPL